MSRSLSRQLTGLLTARSSRSRSRAGIRALEVLEPRTLLSTIYYVDSSAPFRGQNGMPAHPYNSIGAAVAAVQEVNVTIKVRNGYNYHENVTIPSQDSGLQILADSGQNPILVGSGGTGFSVNATGVTITGFKVVNFDTGISVASGGGAAINTNTIYQNATGVEVQSGGAASLDGDIFNGAYANDTDLMIDAGAGTVTVGSTAGDAFNAANTYIDNESIQTIAATTSTFAGFLAGNGDPTNAADLASFYATEDKITDVLDNPAIGYVSLKNANVFVSQLSESTTAGAIQRGINVATSGNTIHVQAGSFDITGGLNIAQAQLTLVGAKAGVSGSDGSRGTGESILNGPTTSSIAAFTIPNSSNVSIDGFTLNGTGSSTGSRIIAGEPQSIQLGFMDNVFSLNAMSSNFQTNIILSDPQSVTLTDNAFTTTGSSPTNSALIQIAGSYAGGTDTSNVMTVTGNKFTGIADSSSQSTLQLNFSNVQGQVAHNLFNGVDIGILVANSTGNLTIDSNTFENITRGSTEIATGSYGTGIAFYNPSFTNGPITISNNAFTSSDTGMRTSTDGSGGPYTLSSPTVSITGNTFAGDLYDIVDKFSGELDPSGTNSFDGATLSTATLAQLYAIEDKIVNAIDVSGYGLVRLKAQNVYVTTNSDFPPGGTTTPSIQRGIIAASINDSVNVQAGTYAENVAINKRVNLVGAGSTTDSSSTIIHPSSGNGLTFQASGISHASPLLVSNIGVNFGTLGSSYGLDFDTTLSHISLVDVSASKAAYGLEIHNSGVVSDLNLSGVSLTNNTTGFRVSTTGQVNGLTIDNSHFDSNVYGLETDLPNNSTTNNQNAFTGISISNSTFNDDADKGIYVEKLDHATFTNITVTNSGTDAGSPDGIDINLKYGTYSTNSINGANLTNDGIGKTTGAGLAIKGRNDAPSYSSNPASLSGVTLTGVTISGSPIDVSIGNNVTGITMSGVHLEGSGIGLVYYVTAADTLSLGDTAFDGTLAAYIGNSSANGIDATGGATFNGFNTGTGSVPANLSSYYAIEDKIVDAIDVSGLGLVRLLAGNVFVTPNSYYAPTTTTPSVQRGVDAASVNDLLSVEGGTYPGQVTIGKSLTVTGSGAGSTILQSPATALTTDTYGKQNLVEINNSATVTMSALTVTGPGPGPNDSIDTGIAVLGGANLTLSNASVTNIRDNPLSGDQNGEGIRVGQPRGTSTPVTTGSATITNVTVSGYQKNGIVVAGSGSSATITSSTVTGVGSTTAIAQNGIEVVNGASAAISNNAVSGNEYSGSTGGADPINATQSAGILVIQAASGLVISGNTIDGNDIGIYTTGSGVQITGNTLGNTTANRYEAVLLDQGDATLASNTIKNGNIGVVLVSYSGSTGNSSGALAAGNTITGATVAGVQLLSQSGTTFKPSLTVQAGNTIGSNAIGIDVEAGSTTMSGSVLTSNTTGVKVNSGASASISTSTISGSSTGVQVVNSSSATISQSSITNDSVGILVGTGSSDVNTLTAIFDDLTGDTTGVQSNQTSGPLNATNNYWGSLHGPTNSSANPGGNGAAVTGNVNFSPWIGLFTNSTPSGPGFVPTSITNYAVPTQLNFTTQPSSTATSGQAFATQPVVTATDASNNLGINFNGQVTLALHTTSGSGTLAGTNPVTASGGVATFSGLNIAGAGTFTLTASAASPWNGLTTATSTAITVTSSTASATFLTQDTTHSGSWIGVYGANGNNVVGDPTHYPSYATVAPSGNATYVWAGSTSDTRALQNPGGSGRIAAAWYNNASFTVDVNLTDGQAHNLELYFLDWDHSARSEKVQISTTGGTVLDTETVSSFSNGVYLNWKVSGHVVFKITNVTGPNAVLSGMFFDAPTTLTSSATFLTQDTTHSGSWIGVYGANGNNVVGDPTHYPSYATVAPSGNATYVWAGSTSDTRALQNPGGSGRIAAAWYNNASFTVDVNLTDGQAHNLELYFLDWDHSARSEKVQVTDFTTGAVLDTETVSSFSNGVYLNWKVSGHVVFKITILAGPNAVLSGMFFDPPSSSPTIATKVGGSAGATGIGITADSNPSNVAIGTVAPSSNGTAAVLPATLTDTPARGLIYDLALEQVSGRTRRNRGGFGF